MSKPPDASTAKLPAVSRLLIAEPPLLVLPSLAVQVGLNEAIFLQQLHYWLQGKAAKERDGRVWIYNTYEEWHQQLPFWSVMTIRRIVGGLEQQGIVRSTTRYNQHRVDRTKWYTIDYAVLDRLVTPEVSESPDHVINVNSRMVNLNSPSDQDEPLQAFEVNSSEPETSTETIKAGELEDSKIRQLRSSIDIKYDSARLDLLPYVEDFAREFADQAPLSSSTSRVVTIYKQSGLDLVAFVTAMQQARAITKERAASIRAHAPGGAFPKKPKMAYFLAVLEDVVGGGERIARMPEND